MQFYCDYRIRVGSGVRPDLYILAIGIVLSKSFPSRLFGMGVWAWGRRVMQT